MYYYRTVYYFTLKRSDSGLNNRPKISTSKVPMFYLLCPPHNFLFYDNLVIFIHGIQIE